MYAFLDRYILKTKSKPNAILYIDNNFSALASIIPTTGNPVISITIVKNEKNIKIPVLN